MTEVLSNQNGLSQSKLKSMLNTLVHGTYVINEDGSVDVDGSVDFITDKRGASRNTWSEYSKWNVSEIPIQFNKVTKNFYICASKLKTLIGSPKEVGGDYQIQFGSLQNLEGAPEKVGGSFLIVYNDKLTSLEGGPKEVGGDFVIKHCRLTSLEGGPKEVGGDYDVSSNHLTSLIGSPKEVGKSFDCGWNYIENFNDGPEEIGKDLICTFTKTLLNLDGFPKVIKGNVNFKGNSYKFTDEDKLIVDKAKH